MRNISDHVVLYLCVQSELSSKRFLSIPLLLRQTLVFFAIYVSLSFNIYKALCTIKVSIHKNFYILYMGNHVCPEEKLLSLYLKLSMCSTLLRRHGRV